MVVLRARTGRLGSDCIQSGYLNDDGQRWRAFVDLTAILQSDVERDEVSPVQIYDKSALQSIATTLQTTRCMPNSGTISVRERGIQHQSCKTAMNKEVKHLNLVLRID